MTNDFIRNGKILDRSRRLIDSRFAERRKILPEEINRILRKMQIEGMAYSGPEVTAVLNACEQEVRAKSDIAWDSLQKARKAFGSPITETLATDLKQEMSHHIEKIVKDASELMAKRLSFMKPDAWHIDLEKTKSEVNERISVEVDLYVDSLVCKSTKTQQKGKTELKAATKRQRIWIFIKGFVKETYRITIKSFFDSTMNK